MVSWVIAVLGLLVGLGAWYRARAVSRRLDALTKSYWELRYDYTRLRSQLARLDPDARGEEPEPPPAAPPSSVSFVPLSSIRKKDR